MLGRPIAAWWGCRAGEGAEEVHKSVSLRNWGQMLLCSGTDNSLHGMRL